MTRIGCARSFWKISICRWAPDWKLAGKVFRVGHLGSFNDLMLAGTLSGIEMGLRLAGMPHNEGGVMAALNFPYSSGPKDRAGKAAR